METQEIKRALSGMELLNVLDLYFKARTGHRCFSDEFLPVNLLAELYKMESLMHRCNDEVILQSLQSRIMGDDQKSVY